MNAIYIEVAKENNTKRRMLGLGDRSSMYTSCGSHSTGGSAMPGIDTEAMTQQLSSLQTELQEEKNERVRMMEQIQSECGERKQLEEQVQSERGERKRLEEQVQTQAAEAARMKEQLDMLMQQFMRLGHPPS